MSSHRERLHTTVPPTVLFIMSSHSLIVVIFAVVTGILATLLFVVAVANDSWETMQFDYDLVNKTANSSGLYQSITPIWSLFSDNKQIGAKLVSLNLSSAGKKQGYCLFDIIGGVWRQCVNDFKDSDNILNDCTTMDSMKTNTNCFNYIIDYRIRRNLPGSFEDAEYLIKMQNNTIACYIVVLLCASACMCTAGIGVVLRVVPAVMVTGVLYLMCGIFVVFGNSIEHEKLRRMGIVPSSSMCNNCHCYSILGVPKELCTKDGLVVMHGWSLIIAWLAVFLYFVACSLWLYFTRLLRIDKGKSMI